MTRTRYGAELVNVSPAWVRVHPTGVRKIIITLGLEVGITAEVRFKATWDVKPGDFVYFAEFDLTLFVYQVIPEVATSRALCQEVPQFIPDEFNRSFVEGFWTQTLNGGSIDLDPLGYLKFTLPAPASEQVGDGIRITQTLSGDFDVFMLDKGSASGLGAGDKVFTGIIAWLDSTHYVCAGRFHTSAPASYIVRVDKVTSEYGDETNNALQFGQYYRLRRIGNIFTAFGALTISNSTIPTSEDEWTAIQGTGNELLVTSEDVQVGLCGYKKDSNPQTSFYDFIRNWVPTATDATLDGLVITNVQMTGTKDGSNKVFTIPATFVSGTETIYWNGGRQVRDDDYTINGSTITFSAGHPAPASGDTLVADFVRA